METIKKCLDIALGELSKLSFSGPATIPAGRAMDALTLATAEITRLEREAQATAELEGVSTDG